MPPPKSPVDNPTLAELFASLDAHRKARQGLEAKAPRTCAAHGGAEAIMKKLGGRMVRKGWWAIDFTSGEGQLIWCQLAEESQAKFRSEAIE